MGIFADRIAAGKSCFVIWWMLSLKRTFIIKQKGIFQKAIIAYASSLPEPTKERTRLPNTHILIDTEEWFFNHYTNKGRKALLKAFWKIVIVENEHDGDMSDLLNAVLGKIKESDWKPRLKHPKNWWKE